MRKFLPLLIAFLVLFPSCAATLSLPELEQESDLFAWWLHNLKSPEQLQAFLKNCTYISDFEQFGKIEYYQTPDEFFHNHRGDCEDFAYFSAYVFLRKQWAFRSWVVLITLRKNLGHHGLAVAQTDKGFVGIDYAYISPPFSTFDEAVRHVALPYGYSYTERIFEVHLPKEKSASKKKSKGNFCPLEGCP